MRRAAFILALGVAALVLPPSVSAQQAQQQSTNANLVLRGAQIYGANCARCHNLRSPTEFTDLAWRTIISQMRARANLTRAEARAVLAFVQATNGVGGPTPGTTAMNSRPAATGPTQPAAGPGEASPARDGVKLSPAQQRALDAYQAKLTSNRR